TLPQRSRWYSRSRSRSRSSTGGPAWVRSPGHGSSPGSTACPGKACPGKGNDDRDHLPDDRDTRRGGRRAGSGRYPPTGGGRGDASPGGTGAPAHVPLVGDRDPGGTTVGEHDIAAGHRNAALPGATVRDLPRPGERRDRFATASPVG